MGTGAIDRRSPGLVLVVSGPSGSGKSTLVTQLLELREFPLGFSVSSTSRAPRAGEIPGQHYRFLSRDTFLAMQAKGEFLESAEVHGHLYGTPREPVEQAVRTGQWVLLEIDVQGHRQVKKWMPEAISFFIRAASLDDYARRLRARGTESEEDIARRLESVRRELECATEYDYQILNEDVTQAVRTWRTLLIGIDTARGRMNV